MHEMEQLRREVVRARRVAYGAVGLALFAVFWAAIPASGAADDGILEVRGLVVQDAAGVPRVVIGAPAPDPSTGPRVGAFTGVLINGADGTERGGYGVFDASGEAVITLDGVDTDVFKVVANKNAGASMFLGHKNGAFTALTTYRGAPELHLVGPDDKPLFVQPPGTLPLQ